MLALVYEAIVEGMLQYDYAPESTLIGSRRVWANISQDANDDLNDLVEAKLLRELRMFTRGMQPVRNLQVSREGMLAIQAAPNIMHRVVEDFAYHGDELLQARWAMLPTDAPASEPGDEGEGGAATADGSAKEDEEPAEATSPVGDEFWWEEKEGTRQMKLQAAGLVSCIIYTESGLLARKSGITDIEDVSYVTSPYLPQLLINKHLKLRELSDFSSRAHEAAEGLSLIRGEVSETILLGGVRLIVGEWLPFGLNQIAYLNERLGAKDRCKGGMFTDEVDRDGESTDVKTATGLTEVSIIDAHPVTHINLEAELQYPEEEGIIQLENFGIHLSHNGGILYGLKFEAVHDRTGDDMSLDLLARAIVDVHDDSAKIINNLLSVYQREMVEAVYGTSDRRCRQRFNCLIAAHIRPKLDAKRYMDGEDLENELKQVIGEVKSSHNLSTEDVLILGRHGMLVAGPNVVRHEDFITLSILLLSLDLFVRTFFTRLIFISQEMVGVRRAIEQSGMTRDSSRVVDIQRSISRYSRTLVLLAECLQYATDTLESVEKKGLPKALQDPWDITGKELLKCLKWSVWRNGLAERVVDLQQSMDNCERELRCLRQTAEWVNTMQMARGCERIKVDTRTLAYGGAKTEKAMQSLQMMQIMMTSTLAWTMLDRLTGFDQEVDFGPESKASGFQKALADSVVGVPLMNFFLALFVAAALSYSVYRRQKRMAKAAESLVTVPVQLNVPADVDVLKLYLDRKDVTRSRIETHAGRDVKIVRWQEKDSHTKNGILKRCRKRAGIPPAAETDEQIDPLAASLESLRAASWNGLGMPTIELVYEVANKHLCTATFTVDTTGRADIEAGKRADIDILQEELRDLFVQRLERAGVVAPGL